MNQNNNLSIPQAIVFAGLLIAVAIFLRFSPVNDKNSIKLSNKNNSEDIYLNNWKVKPKETKPNDHRLGKEDAQIEIIEFSDTECPFCKVFHKILHQVVDNYDGEIAWVYKHLPLQALHTYAYNEAVATECAEEEGGNIAFWNYLEAIFKNTDSNDGLPPYMLKELAKDMGFDMDRFLKCLEDPSIHSQVDLNIAEAKSLIEKLGTPYSFIKKDGKIVDTIQGAASFADVISKIEKAKNL